MLKSVLNVFVMNREHYLYAPVKVSGHPVCTSEIILGIASVFKSENAGMLKEISDYGSHTYMIAELWYTGSQTAYTTNDKVNLHTGLTGLIKSSYNLRIAK